MDCKAVRNAPMDCHQMAKLATSTAQKSAEDMEARSGTIVMLECQIDCMQEQIEALLEIIDLTVRGHGKAAWIRLCNFIDENQI